MIKEWLLARILKGKIVLFEQDNEFTVINDIYFGDGIVICRNTDLKEFK